ncbi:hypothetical protein N474_23900 [Pseudoalteromonas luteoviolacea CPMOR-2]|uniref:Transmembrane protein n=1 Tax=Pseudoalteromonas luteoviolacea DSM 6061 TaxID=1365250 RepID=A0A161XIB7_9GAMM|nr:DUF3025 domain-containing protein [Pseudoalteromonas luteoviolacea]KZN30769.1 hypothetical protein N475_05025 [Pseudoalteromonas luteoviolacea DSM 6061]KZN51718.1 hypothetical protein N474_23900 [Pseudoalteromonas luteoviolacea CPMOR-2]MBE0386428.1 hypothetical protein [Pseudoalteromonas luteoviolacea DSM 6061]
MKKFTAPENWHSHLFNDAPFGHLQALFNLQRFATWPSFDWLNSQLSHSNSAGKKIVFTPNALLENETRYYEEIIAQTGQVPTREDNWHDFFGAMIWCLFPKTKSLLNQLHTEEIKLHGLKQRSRKRNALTLFDECGLVLAIPQLQWRDKLREHKWTEVFYEHRNLWHNSLIPFVFGHANYEMLTNPFIGLTGKLLCIVVEEPFYDLPLTKQYAYLDNKLVQLIQEQNVLDDNTKMSPLPLLGIPQWHSDSQNEAFYANQDYFRPKRRNSNDSSQRAEKTL